MHQKIELKRRRRRKSVNTCLPTMWVHPTKSWIHVQLEKKKGRV